MLGICNFIRKCSPFFVLTNDAGQPEGRPFGAIMAHENMLYIATSDEKAVYRQLIADPRMQLIALKPGTREWIRVAGLAEECTDYTIKEKMLIECPNLTKHYPSADAPHYNLFAISVQRIERY